MTGSDTNKLNVKSIVARLKSETPPFWIKVRKWMIGCGTIGLAIAAVPAEHLTWIPDAFQHVDSALITIGAIGTALSSLTAVDNTEGK